MTDILTDVNAGATALEGVASLTQEALNNSIGVVPTQAVEAFNSLPAPADPVQAFILSAERRLAQIEQVVGLAAPILDVAGAAASVEAPGLVPLITRMNGVENVVERVLGSLAADFGGKSTAPPPGSVVTANAG